MFQLLALCCQTLFLWEFIFDNFFLIVRYILKLPWKDSEDIFKKLYLFCIKNKRCVDLLMSLKSQIPKVYRYVFRGLLAAIIAVNDKI